MVGSFEEFYDPKTTKRHECDRVCKEGERQKRCRYDFTISEYTTMGKVSYM